MSDNNAIITSGFVGETGVGKKALMKDIRILSTAEIFALIEDFMNKTGLRRNQFAVNGWGFPFIPVPEVQRAYNNVRIAPKNVTKAFFGHPIYWIDPDLTVREPGEGEQEWCIRMFFLIDAMGYWTETVEFVDFLQVNGFSFDEAQIKTYHRIADQDCETDDYSLLDTSDLDVPMDQIKKDYADVLDRCFHIQQRESLDMLKSQGRQYLFAQKALGPGVYSWSSSYSDHGGVWDTRFRTDLEDIATKYTQRARSGDQIVSDLRKRSIEVFDALFQVITRYNHATSILELPVKASIKGNPGGASRIALLASSMSLANREDNMRKVVFKDVETAIKKAFGSGNIGENGFDDVIAAMSSIYATAWNRMRLAYVNYEHLRDGEEIYSTVVEMTSAMQSKSTSGSMGLASVLTEKF